MNKVEIVKALKSGDMVEINTRYGGAAKIKIEKVTEKMVFYRWIWTWKDDGVSEYVMKETHERLARNLVA